MTRPDDSRTGRQEFSATGRPATSSPATALDVPKVATHARRCAHLFPGLTGCPNRAEPDSRYCEEHQADEGVADQLRRRRRSSWRLPPLQAGDRDPLDSGR